MKIVILASLAYSLVNFRGALITAIVARGHDVVACAPDDDPEIGAEACGHGRALPPDPDGPYRFEPFPGLRDPAPSGRFVA